jgi:NAD(P)-dependent dehydrogenase (short-subunit alcohol dehydrogenase family)
METLQGKRALVVGGSRGFGRGVVEELLAAGADVHVIARGEAALDRLRADLDGRVAVTAADAADPVVAGQMLDAARPDILVLVAGAAPLLRPLQQQTWESFSRNWQADVKLAFHWLREVLLLPLAAGSEVVVFSSGAALRGSPLSGGYAGAKATQRFIAQYAADESGRAGLGIRITAVLPQLSPATELGRPAVTAYARRAGLSEEAYRGQMGTPLSPQLVGEAVVRLLIDPALAAHQAYMLTAAGLAPLD